LRQAGILMPGTIFLGARPCQEIAPNALDQSRDRHDGKEFEVRFSAAGAYLGIEQGQEDEDVEESD
jgi:hypothetical protein